MVFVLLVASAIVWCVGFALNPTGVQGLVFSDGLQDLFGDYFLNCDAWQNENHYQGTARVPSCELCYPLLAYWPLSLFPKTIMGAGLFAILGSACYIAGILIFIQSRFRNVRLDCKILATVACVCAFQLVLAFERGNLILFSVAGICIFLAWYDSNSPVKRFLAAISLAGAGVLKVMPGLLGLLYFYDDRETKNLKILKNRFCIDWVSVICCSVTATAAFWLPYWLHGRGLADFGDFMANVSSNAQMRIPQSAWGLVPFWRILEVLDIHVVGITLRTARMASVLLCLSVLAIFVFCKRSYITWIERLFLLTFLLMVMPTNTCSYTGLYLVPVMLASVLSKCGHKLSRCDVSVMIAWVILFMPIIIPARCLQNCICAPLNYTFSNVAFLFLLCVVVTRIARRYR